MNEEHDHIATPSEACREYAWNVGSEHQERAWILTDFDTWEPNPYYRGDPVPHPESYEAEHGLEEEEYVPPAPPIQTTSDEDLPF